MWEQISSRQLQTVSAGLHSLQQDVNIQPLVNYMLCSSESSTLPLTAGLLTNNNTVLVVCWFCACLHIDDGVPHSWNLVLSAYDQDLNDAFL